jgi:pterin-4a-carbinolamine dehydratase/cell wall-associated NlpC family hydrolase
MRHGSDARDALDGRVLPARPDLAAAYLTGVVEAARFVEGRRMTVVAAAAPLRVSPQSDATLHTEVLRGEIVTVYEDREGWAWAQFDHDASVGYLPSEALRTEVARPTHRVAALRTFLYPVPDMKLAPLDALPYGAQVAATGRRGDFAVLADGFVWDRHLTPIDSLETDAVAVAERFLGAAYLWGGRTPSGVDCSGLVQIAFGAAGVAAPRDSDQQEEALGRPLPSGAPLRRGDLVFWAGHVGVMRDRETLLHANGSAMAVTSELLTAVRARRDNAGEGSVTSVRRLERPVLPEAAGSSEDLTGRTCTPCRGGVPPLSADEAERHRTGTPDWSIEEAGARLVRRYRFKTYRQAFDLVTRISALAEAERHHPDIRFGWAYCEVTLTTHAIGGLHLNDFILAAKIDRLTG